MKQELESRMDTSAGLDAAPFTPNNDIAAACQLPIEIDPPIVDAGPVQQFQVFNLELLENYSGESL
jgi:hypothetical protein